MSSASGSSADQPQAWGLSLPKWTRITLIWLMLITVSGAAVRLTGSGLGCTDWPTCTVNTELDAPGFHSAIEFGNRVISGLAIIPVIAAFIAARRGDRDDLRRWFIAMIVGFLGQVLLGMLVTRTELDPRVVLGHFLLSIVLLFIAVVLAYRARHIARTPPNPDLRVAARNRMQIGQVLALSATAVIVVGTLVTGSGPHTGSEESGEPIARLGFDIREISRIHSIFGWIVVMIIVYGLIQNRPSQPSTPWRALDRLWLTRIGAVALVQGAIGYVQYLLGVPVGLVAVHIAGAVVLWTMVVWYVMVASDPTATIEHGSRAPEPAQ